MNELVGVLWLCSLKSFQEQHLFMHIYTGFSFNLPAILLIGFYELAN